MKNNVYQNQLKIFFWIFFGTFSLGQLQRFEISQFFPSISSGVLYLHELLMGLLVLRYGANTFSILKPGLKNHYLKLLFAWILLSSTVAQIQQFDAISLMYLLRLGFYIFFAITIFSLIQQKKIEIEYFHFQLFSTGIFTLLLGFLQYVFIPDTRFLSIFGWDDHYARLIGTYFDPGFTGLILVVSLILGISHKLLQKYTLPIFISFGLGIALTFSRASYLSLLIGVVTLLVYKIKNRTKIITYTVLFTAVFILLLALIPKPMGEGVDLVRTASITARFTALERQIQSIDAQTLLIGNGMFGKVSESDILPNEIRDTILPSHSRVPDNMFVAILLYLGLPGLLLFFIVLKNFAWKHKNNPWLISILLTYIIHAQFANSLFQPFTQLMLLLSGVVFIPSKTQKYT